MENFIFKNVSFAYPEQEKKALDAIGFSDGGEQSEQTE